MNQDKKKWLLVLGAGIIAILAGIMIFLSDKNIAENYTETAVAVVYGYDEREELDAASDIYRTVYYPIMIYSADGREITETYSQMYSDPPYEIGASVEITYNPDDPTQFSITEDNRSKVTFLWEIPVGIILILLAVYNLKKLRVKIQEGKAYEKD